MVAASIIGMLTTNVTNVVFVKKDGFFHTMLVRKNVKNKNI